MAFTRPTLEELVTRIEADFSSRLSGGSTLLRRSVVKVLARVWAGALHLVYGFLAWIARQIMPDTAEGTQLRRWARIFKVTPKAATFASFNVTLTGVDGSEIAATTTEFQRADGKQYVAQATVLVAGGTATVAVLAKEPGTLSNCAAATALNLVSPIAGVNSQCVVAAGGIVDGQDDETDESLLSRLLARIQSPPHGGSKDDYEAWALEVAGVTRAWPYPSHLGAGTVGVAFVMDNQVGTIIPNPAKVAEVQAYIDDPSRRPVTAQVTVFAPIADALNFTITPNPVTAEVKAAIEAELRDLISRESEPNGTLLISHIREAISKAAGENDHTLTAPVANVVTGVGHITVFGAITWV